MMNGDVETIHVVFGCARAETIRNALRVLGSKERVIGLPNDLSLGPINPPDPDVRQEWIKSSLRCEPHDDMREAEKPWTEATSSDVYPIYWVCMNDAFEHASFLEFAHRMTGRPFDIVDATGLDFVTARNVRMPWSLGLMAPEDIVASGVYDRRRSLALAEIAAASERWSRLREENAPLRIVKDGILVSAPLTYFDTFLINQAATDWEVAAKLIGRTMNSLAFDMDPPGRSPSDILLFGRVLALGEGGALDVTGPGPDMRNYKVRKTNKR